ncbi:hypothetical protein HKD37_11G031881 [Glycine soja]
MRRWRGGLQMAAAIAMAVMEDMVARQKMTDFFYFLSAVGVGLTRPNPTRSPTKSKPAAPSPAPSVHTVTLPHPTAPSRTQPRHPLQSARRTQPMSARTAVQPPTGTTTQAQAWNGGASTSLEW